MPVDEHFAGPTLFKPAAEASALQAEPVAQNVKQRFSGFMGR